MTARLDRVGIKRLFYLLLEGRYRVLLNVDLFAAERSVLWKLLLQMRCYEILMFLSIHG